MPQLVKCPHCQKQLNVPDNLLGKKVKCPNCQNTFTALVESNTDFYIPPGSDAPPLGSPEAASPSSASGGFIGDVVFFRRMIAPTVIQILFWILTAFCFLVSMVIMVGGFIGMVSGSKAGFMGGGFLGCAAGVFVGLFNMIVGTLLLRLYAEIAIVIFRIYESLKDIQKNLPKSD